MSKKKDEGKSAGTCAWTGCTKPATRKKKTRDGKKISLCEEHFRAWK